MAITINGTGSISGISAGGLPDGVITRPDMGYAGAILQVMNATYSTPVTSSSSTYADTGLTATITPTSASSKILVLVNQVGCIKETNNTYLALQLLRGSTIIAKLEGNAGYNGSTSPNYFGACSCCYLDNPATTSAVTYKTQLASSTNAAQVGVQTANAVSTITLLEVAA